MSNLLSQASLVMIPSGYKEDVVYSQIPTSGAGDLSFTRASNGTRINSAGLVEDCPWNLLSYSEDFTNAYWTKTNASISANTTTAPNGTTTADSFIESTSATGNRAVFISPLTITSGSTFNLSIYVKSLSANRNIYLRAFDTSFAIGFGLLVNPLTGEIVTTQASGGASLTNTNVESLSNDWYRISASGVLSTATTLRFSTYLVVGTNTFNYQGDGTSGVFIWGAQLNIGSISKPYFPTTDRLNVPRLTYQNGGGGCPSLLLEPQRTNSILRSEEFDNAAWTKTASTVTANSTISPNGTQNADTLTGNGISSTHSVFQSANLTSGVNYTISVYAKKNTNNFLQIYGFSTGYGVNSWANFDLNNGVVGSVGSSASATITNVGNGWYRCTISIVAVSTATDAFVLNLITSATSSRGENSTLSTSVFLWGCQFEQGAYPTSYIPTTSSSATRVAEGSFTSGLSALIGQTEGTLFAIISSQQAGSFYNWLNLSDNTVNNWVFIGKDSTKWRAYVKSNGSVIFDNSSISITNNTFTKIALAYKSGDIALYINGTQIATSSGTFTFSGTLSKVSIGDISNVVGDNAQYSEILVSKTRLSNSELASLTTI